ncbi:anti-sigma factor family protein [Pseudacidovorax intermedius]|uniref:anti-sigma factor family protein n=1 Tax=Pseudacidovorax intermedius TaxID=433924 RepID=UPI00034B044C|nr:anti-sigma factor [Pseudacidovorax intermedius]
MNRPAPPPTHHSPDEEWDRLRRQLRQLHAPVLEEAPPAGLLAAAKAFEEAVARKRRQAQALRWSGMAAAVVLAFGAGWSANGLQGATGGHTMAATQAPPLHGFVREAAVAYSLYVPEKRHPVEVGAAEEQHLVQWLSRRLDRPLKLPDLASQGYAPVGGRLLPGTAGARAQFMYQNAEGQRLTLYLGQIDAGAPEARGAAFRFEAGPQLSTFYWVDDGFGYALSAPLGRDRLLALAQTVHGQL